MSVRSVVLAVVLLAPTLARADDETRVQLSPYLEAGGPGLYWTANADLRLGRWFALRGGFMTTSDGECADCEKQPPPVWAFPVGTSLVIGEVHSWETQLGIEPLVGGTSRSSYEQLVGFVGTGYRYQSREEGLFFRASVYVLARGAMVLPWAGLSVGYAFSLGGAQPTAPSIH